jgi:hypothetical protein
MIERMEDFILTGMGIPFTPFTIVNGEKLVPLLDRIRENMPAEIQHAQRVLDRRDEIVNEAQAKANQILQDAKKQSEFMLSESELLRAVHEEANRIRQQITMELEAMRKKTFEEAEAAKAQAFEEANAIRAGSDQYAEAILGSLDKSLAEFQAVVKNGQRYLKKARMDAAQQMPPALSRSHSAYTPASQENYGEQSAEENYSSGSSISPSYAQEFLRQTTLSGNP